MDENCTSLPFYSLNETAQLMCIGDYKERFVAEYVQAVIRKEKLSNFIAKISATETFEARSEKTEKKIRVRHDCPTWMLQRQLQIMGNYVDVLKERAYVEKISLPKVVI